MLLKVEKLDVSVNKAGRVRNAQCSNLRVYPTYKMPFSLQEYFLRSSSLGNKPQE
jgi:hypothetical protein